MATEWREETCPNCGATRERVWVTRLIPKGSAIPVGFRREHTGATWVTIAGRTRDTTLCLCDVAV